MSPKQTPIVEVNDIATASDLARLLGLTPSAISNWRKRKRNTFPNPITHVNGGHTPLWRKSEVVHWWRMTHSELADAILSDRLADALLQDTERT